MRADPAAAALAAVRDVATRFVVHFDMDVIDLYDLPVADVPLHNAGLTLGGAMSVLAELGAAPGFAGVTVCEFNPDHGAPDGSTTDLLADALAHALAGRAAGAP